ncbi:phosphatase PAP2 family protein [Hymenobacter saemangeumensis]|uniref:Phosphatase PAP2 family protein n=1 Tax=Hymenobacter saemangeumensis TaxID=1084522 RepID=A0ABP8IFW5_9BACT
MRYLLIALLLVLSLFTNAQAQVVSPLAAGDSLRKASCHNGALRRTALKVGVPVGLVGLAWLGHTQGNVVNTAKSDLQTRTQAAFPNFDANGLDDYSRHAPLAMAYAMMATGRRGERTPLAFTLIYVMAHELDGAVVSNLKRETAIARPFDPNSLTSFPSSHTSQAFLTATLLHEQYGREYPWLSVSGYAVATATGALRVLGNRHWVNDVLAGGAIGFLSAEAAWHVFPLLTKLMPEKVGQKLLLVPTYLPGGAGIALAFQP